MYIKNDSEDDSIQICEFCEAEIDIEDNYCQICGMTKETTYT